MKRRKKGLDVPEKDEGRGKESKQEFNSGYEEETI